jgi:hypothetical protein
MADEHRIKALEKLITQGSCPAKTGALDALLSGLAHPCAKGRNWVISQRLLQVRQQLNSDQELMAAMLATEPELRLAWCRLMAARSQEAGELSDPLALVRLVSQLNGAADWVEAAFDQASLEATGFAESERSLLGVSAEQSQATPVLARVLSVSSQLTAWQSQPLPDIAAVNTDGTRPDINWCSGRLLQRPGEKASEFQYLLSGCARGSLAADVSLLDKKQRTLAVMDWVLANPWAYLLALVVYEQNIWQVESAGGLLLELPAGQSPQQPSEVQVLVANAAGDELYCGHLGTYVSKVLSRLNMGVFPAGCSDAQMNAGLAVVISDLLANRVWRYTDGLSGEQGYYQIHPDFSDACYGLKGQPSFSRYARQLRQAIRSQAVQWRNDRKAQGQYQTTASQRISASVA